MRLDIREMPIDELRVVKVYRDLVPQPSAKDLELLRSEIEAHGLDPSHPLVVNEDLVVLDGHSRLAIAKDLRLPTVYVTVKEMGDKLTEREYVIKANLARRQLNTAQRAELGLKLLEIERERAKRRQQLAGQLYGRRQQSPSREEFLAKWAQSLQEQAALEEMEDGKVETNWSQPITCSQSQTGRSVESVAAQVGIGIGTLKRAQTIQQAAEKNPEIASEWEAAKEGKTTVHRVYRKVKVKDLPKHYGAGIKSGPFSLTPEKPEPYIPPPPMPEEKKWEWLRYVTERRGMSWPLMEAMMRSDKTAWFQWGAICDDKIIWQIGWMLVEDHYHDFEQKQIARLVSERPLPEGAESLGPWTLDHAHVVDMAELLRTFPEERAHLVFTDARRSGPEEIQELAAFGQRALVPGKLLCAYVPTGLLPVVLEAMAAHGLEYYWTCAVARPKEKYFEPRLAVCAVVPKWWMLLMFRKPGGETKRNQLLVDCDDGEEYRLPPGPDGLVSNQIFVKDLPRQVVESCTMQGQLVVDPYVRDGGVLGMVAQCTGRRFLLFNGDREQALAAEFHVKQDREWFFQSHQFQMQH